MNKHISYFNVSIIAGIIVALAASSILSTTNSVLASQKKDVECAGGMHTQNYCDGYHLGQADAAIGSGCEESNYRGGEKSHTKDWRDGYNHGWDTSGCGSPP